MSDATNHAEALRIALEVIRDNRHLNNGVTLQDVAAEALASLDALTRGETGECSWWGDGEIWESNCGVAWTFNEGGPEENGMTYCHSCGKRVAVNKETEDVG